jgi:putative ABC transport system permease protein
MSPWRWAMRAWRNWRKRGNLDAELQEELASYVELLAAERERAGMSPAAARRAAILAAGGAEQVTEAVRAVRAGALLDVLKKDVQYALRLMRRSPVVTTVVVATMAVTLGANVAVFSLTHALLLEQLPVQDPDRVVELSNTPLLFQERGFGLSRTVLESGAVESATLYYVGGGANLEGDAGRRITVTQVDTSFLHTMGARAQLGRGFRPEEGVEGANTVVLLSHRLWRQLGGSPAIVGSGLSLSGLAYTVIGVMPRGFEFPAGTDAWLPTPIRFELYSGALAPDAIARLRPAVTTDEAALRLNRAYEARQGQRGPDEPPIGVSSLRDKLTGPIRLPVLLLFGAVTVVLLIGCANVAALLLARASTRDAEFAMRGALGASSGRLLRQMLSEGLLLIVLSGLAGIWLARIGLTALTRLFPAELLPTREITLSQTAFVYTALLCALTTLLVSCAPAIRAARAGRWIPRSATMTGLRERYRFRTIVLGTEVALSVLLVVGAGLLVRSLARLTALPLGFEPAQVVSLQVRLPASRYGQPAQQVAYANTLLERVRALPGVIAAGVSSDLPLIKQMGMGVGVTRADRPVVDERGARTAKYVTASPGYLQAIGARVLRGSDTDLASTARPTAVITESLARQLFGRESAVGQRVRVVRFKREFEVIGVVADVRHNSVTNDPTPVLFASSLARPTPYLGLAVRTSGDVSVLMAQLRAVVLDIDRNVPGYNIRTMETAVASAIGTRYALPVVVSMFALLALLLCAVGTFGLATELVVEQRRALCIRMALGAQRASIIELVGRRALRAAGIGTVAGLLAAIAASRVLSGLLYETDRLDPLTFASVPLLVLAVTIVATAWPAYRAVRLDPATMLRE